VKQTLTAAALLVKVTAEVDQYTALSKGDLSTQVLINAAKDAGAQARADLAGIDGDAYWTLLFNIQKADNIVNKLGDIEKPVITLNGGSTITVKLGDTFADPGTTVTDNVDKDLVAVATGGVDTSIEGTYILTYNVSDLAGNAAIAVTRNVVVSAVVNPDAAAAKTVQDAITALPATITLTNKDAVVAARTAFDGLTATQQALVTNVATLTAAETTIANLEAEAATETAAELTATNAVTALQTAAGKDLTVEANLVAAEAAIKPATDAIVNVKATTVSTDLTAKVTTATTTVTDARTAFNAAAGTLVGEGFTGTITADPLENTIVTVTVTDPTVNGVTVMNGTVATTLNRVGTTNVWKITLVGTVPVTSSDITLQKVAGTLVGEGFTATITADPLDDTIVTVTVTDPNAAGVTVKNGTVVTKLNRVGTTNVWKITLTGAVTVTASDITLTALDAINTTTSNATKGLFGDAFVIVHLNSGVTATSVKADGQDMTYDSANDVWYLDLAPYNTTTKTVNVVVTTANGTQTLPLTVQ